MLATYMSYIAACQVGSPNTAQKKANSNQHLNITPGKNYLHEKRFAVGIQSSCRQISVSLSQHPVKRKNVGKG